MKVNEKLIQEIEKSGLPLEEALIFCAAVEMQRYGTLDWLVGISDIVQPENEHKYRINLCFHDPETDSIKLRWPLFETSKVSASFAEFTKLLSAKGLKYNGHGNNPLAFSILSKEDEGAFQQLWAGLENPDANKLAQITVNYYANTTYAKKLKDFFIEVAPTMYTTFEPKNTGMI